MGGTSSVGEPAVLRPEQTALVRHHLEDILASPAFAGRKRTQDFLRLIVTHTLQGENDSLRERMIGAELFGRPVSYDTGSDSVVRVRASEVRKKLAQFYNDSSDHRHPVRIELPSGSYVPRFHFESTDAQLAAETHPDSAAPEKHAENNSAGGDSVSHAGTASAKPERKVELRRIVIARIAVWSLIAAFLLVVGYAGYRRWVGSANTHKGIHSIAILPLENLSGTPAQDYFADGMTEELINDLGQVSTLRVISLTSSMSYKGTKKKLPDIAKELAVEAVVEGGILRDGNQVRISTQLIDARTDRPIWAHTYTRDLNGAIAWQGEVAQAIAEEISTQLTPQEQAHLARKNTVNTEAQDQYLHGILLREADDCKEAVDFFHRAIAIDPSYAQAHSALASCYGRLGESGRMPYQAAFTQQKAEALSAIQLDDSLSEAHAELANTDMTLDWDWSNAAAEFHRALELNPNSATNHEKYAFYLVRTGNQTEALAEIERSVDLDPVSGSTFHAEGFIDYFSRQYDRAFALTQSARVLRTSLPDWNFLLGDLYAGKGRYAEAIAEFAKSGDGPYSLGHLGNAYARAGQVDAAQRTIARLEQDVRKDGIGRYEIALVYAGLGRKQDAFKWLEEAYSVHDVGLVYLKADPCLDPLRSDPRFLDLLHRVGLR
ncbi:MAG TPA: tetratricopeptide repeat protein [Terracidiphilus sp.]|nr:tetratricopeptide repeat protein [Terracidiphilus sp.]